MTGEPKDPFRYLPDLPDALIDPASYELGENPTHDMDSMAQYGRGLISVGLRNELISKYAGESIFDFLRNSTVNEIKQIGSGANVLSVGAGLGKTEYEVARRTWRLRPNIHATDLYPHFHTYQTLAEDRGFSFLRYTQMDARELEFDDNSMDMTEADFVLYHVLGEKGGPETILAELHRVTALGGKTRVSTRGPRHMRQLWEDWLPGVADYISERSDQVYSAPTTWYPNCDVERTGWLLDRIYGNKRVAFRQVSPEHLDLPADPNEVAPGAYINIPATNQGWDEVQWVIHVMQHNFRPRPPEGDLLAEAIEAVVMSDFFETAARNGGYYPLEIEQAVFEAIKT